MLAATPALELPLSSFAELNRPKYVQANAKNKIIVGYIIFVFEG